MVDLKTQLDSWLDLAFKKELTEVIKIKNLKQTINLITTKARAAVTELNLSAQDIIDIGYGIFDLIFDTIDIPTDRKSVMANTLRVRLKESLSQPFTPAPQEKPKFKPAIKEIAQPAPQATTNPEVNNDSQDSVPPSEVFPTHTPKFMIREITQDKPEPEAPPEPQSIPNPETSAESTEATPSEVKATEPEIASESSPQGAVTPSDRPKKQIFDDVAEVKAPDHKELRVKPAEALSLLGGMGAKKDSGVIDQRTLDMLKTVQVTCSKCHWLYSSRNDACPMCGAQLILSEEELIKFFIEYVDRQGIYLNKTEAINFMKEYKKTYKKLPDLKELWDTAEKIAKLEKMDDAQLKKLQKDKREKDKEKLDLKGEMERIKDKKLQERRVIEEEKRQKEEVENQKKEVERKKKEAELAAKAGGVPCPKCKTKNPPDSKFCLECGQTLE